VLSWGALKAEDVMNQDTRFLRSVIINKLPSKPGRLDVYFLTPGSEKKDETLSTVSPRMIQGPAGEVLEFVRGLPDGSAMTVGTYRLEVRGGQLLPAVDDELLDNQLLDDKPVDLWVHATKAELKEILLRLPSLSGGYEPRHRSERGARDNA
jgi:hypothetical protein